MIILFQGDSITDAGRVRDNNASLGTGYPLLVKASLGYEEPGKHTYYNRGVSGDRIVDVYARIKRDILALKPDVMSLLIGVNDVWHDFHPVPNGVSAEKFYKIYDMLLSEVKQELPKIKIMILEPFTLEGPANEGHYESFRSEVEKRAAMAKKIAEKYALPFIPLQKEFDTLAKRSAGSDWLVDGVHPTPLGHEVIKRAWIQTYKTL